MRTKITGYIKAAYPALFIVSPEEQRVIIELRSVCQSVGYTPYIWSVTDGIRDLQGNVPSAVNQETMRDPVFALEEFIPSGSSTGGMPAKSMLILLDYHQFMGNPPNEAPSPMITRKLKDKLTVAKNSKRIFVMIGCRCKLPPELEREITTLEFGLPTKEELGMVADGIIANVNQVLPTPIALENGERDKVLEAGAGLTTIEFENILAKLAIQHGALPPREISAEKAAVVKKSGLLEIIEPKCGFSAFGGGDGVKTWFNVRKGAFTKKARQFGLPMPKGILLLGPPGTGKSFFCGCGAFELGLPMARVDFGRIMGGIVGESEANVRAVIQQVEALAPCVLQADEIEKALSGTASSGKTDGGTMSRVFGTFLTWMAEKTSPVFVMATANDISQLPPELLRKGRFDELMFIDLPGTSERQSIWSVIIQRFGRSPENYSLGMLSQVTNGYTGAEIEAAFVEAMHIGFAQDREPTDDDIAEAIGSTIPLSKTMGAQITSLREWAQGRARLANSHSTSSEPQAMACGRSVQA